MPGQACEALGRVREIIRRDLTQNDVPCDTPDAHGAFYFFLRVRTALDSMTLVERLVREHKIAVMPGVGVRRDGWLLSARVVRHARRAHRRRRSAAIDDGPA